MTRARGRRPLLRAALAGLFLTLVVTGCGVGPQDRPEPVTTAARTPTGTGTDSRPTGTQLTVYFVRGAVLAPVERPTGAATTAAALEQLVSGPTRSEAATGIRTALPPEVVGVDDDLPEGLTTVSVTRGFTGLAGGDQLLAVAQVVWTLTELPRVTEVRFVVEDRPVEVPADGGLTDQPVDRDDYRSVAPAEPAPTTPPTEDAVTPTGSPPR